MKRSFLCSLSILVFLSSYANAQPPAPVMHYGQSNGARGAGVHTVNPGENLSDVSRRYNVVVQDIIVSNNLHAPFILNTGQRLKLPAPRTYRVRGGDNLKMVSQLYEVPAAEIVRLNKIRAPYRLYTGQVLKMPSLSARARPAVVKTARATKPAYSAPVVERAIPIPAVEREVLNDMTQENDNNAPLTPEPLTPKKAEAPEILTPPPLENEPKGDVDWNDSPAEQAEAPATIKLASLNPAIENPKKQEEAHEKIIEERVIEEQIEETAAIPNIMPKRASTKFLQPVDGKILSTYGSKRDGSHNDGMNIKAAKGTPVKAAENGVVVYVGSALRGSGNLILVRHEDRWLTAYAHLDGMNVKRGDTVERGQTIGTVGQSGSASTPQLHFEVRRGTNAINPKPYLEG